METHYYIYAIFIGLILFFSLIGIPWYLWGSKEVGKRIENRGKIPFSDEPLEERK